MSITHFLPYPFRFSLKTGGEFSLFTHMLATPLTSLQFCLHDSSTPNASSLLPNQNFEKNLAISLQRINDIFYFFTSTKNPSKQLFTLSELVTTLHNLFPEFSGSIDFCYLENGEQNLTTIQLYGNKFLLEEALLCLIKNSLESYKFDEMRCVKITFWMRESKIYISIKDYGAGMTTFQKLICQLPSISFKRFGSGIGLSFAKSVIEQLYHGKLVLTSIQNLGTEVICIIPVPQTYSQTHELL